MVPQKCQRGNSNRIYERIIMKLRYIKKIPSAEEIIAQLPFPPAHKELKEARDNEIADIIRGKSERMLLIVGPCSAHEEEAVVDYVTRLASLQEQVKDALLIVPRIYTNKPRTTGVGYKGMAHQPHPEKEPDIAGGIMSIRKMHLRVFAETHLSAADEMLYPDNSAYLEDVLSYIAVGARSVENQQHRLVASGLTQPVGMKNPTSGDINVMLNSIYAAQSPHIFLYNDWEVESKGNELAHAVLRGAANAAGESMPNYHYEDLINTIEAYRARSLNNQTIVVDTNHSNSRKQYVQQPRIAYEIMENRRLDSSIRKTIKGLMVESYIAEGKQPVTGKEYGKSITDPCLGWEQTKALILELAGMV